MAVRKAGLGKGLDSLIPEHSVRRKAEKTEQKPEKNELLLKITDIEPNREQPRKHFDEDALLELSDSIKQFGIIQPQISLTTVSQIISTFDRAINFFCRLFAARSSSLLCIR